jgi:hypothetical protein
MVISSKSVAFRPQLARPARLLTAAAAALAVLSLSAGARADGDDEPACRFVEGPFSSVTVPPPACLSPVGLCTHGFLKGEFPAIYDFTFSTLQSTNDPSDPTAFVYTGHSVVTTSRGVIDTNDSGILHLGGPGALSPFVTTASIAKGTERYQGATGVFVATGSLDFATGAATGTFIAHVCGTGRDSN